MPVWRWTIATFVVLAAVGCAREQRPAVPPAGVEGGTPPRRLPAMPVLSPQAYVANAGAIDLFIIGSSGLALQRSTNPGVREIASMMIDAHKGMSAQLSLAGRRLNLLPSAALDPRHQAMLNGLQQSADFDGAYRRDLLAVHEEALAIHEGYAARGTSPTLRPVAATMVPVIERHLGLIKYL